jgi:hypothetical protein
MTILTTRTRWSRPPSRERRIRNEQRHLTAVEQANVRHALAVLCRRLGSLSALAHAMGMTEAATTKARAPSRAQSARLALATARLAGVTFDAIISGEWPPQVPCPECRGTGHVSE